MIFVPNWICKGRRRVHTAGTGWAGWGGNEDAGQTRAAPPGDKLTLDGEDLDAFEVRAFLHLARYRLGRSNRSRLTC